MAGFGEIRDVRLRDLDWISWKSTSSPLEAHYPIIFIVSVSIVLVPV
jgi:hypothetical protein